ncbi:UDP-forming cellulose synthase catalytic subunit [Xylophilus sp. GW821-FHT01B05]
MRVVNHPAWGHATLRWSTGLLGLGLFILVFTVPLNLGGQVAFAVVSFVAALLLRKVPGRLPTLAMIVFSITASMRYIYWRFTDTLGFEGLLDNFFGTGLVLAELYALAVLLLGYFQTAWPLERKPLPMPADRSSWPAVDVLIPTYNEPLEVVKQTVFAAMGLDWPADRLNIFLLDDGRRPEFRDFCTEIGVGYLTRDDNRHAKAGNINAALKQTSSELVAIFDCDHIPARSFMQICVGWFLRDPKLAMLQTPHYFFSPDPFEKNLDTFRAVPNEGELFYGLVQDGNDLWNATFFCGSCALIRRAPLEEIGGVAVETVTEDAHTALKLNRHGYNTAYLAIPQAAGLATESLSGHIGQRIRWARGMAQISRLDNPLTGPGLRLGQRLCYMNAMLHFFYGLPRIIFMTAPLAYLLFGAHVYQATAAMIAAFALPHLMHASITNSRMQGRFRHSFWNEVYESVLAWYILRPVLTAFINPRLGKFNVTAKGGLIDHSYFDWGIARPYLLLMAVNLIGLAIGLVKFSSHSGEAASTLAINLVWTIYNAVILGASIAVASESRQVRRAPRVDASLRAVLTLASGRTVVCKTEDFSQTGLGLLVPADLELPQGELLHVTLFRNEDEASFPAEIVFRNGAHLGLQFQEMSLPQQAALTQMTFARADLWASSWGHGERDTPLRALAGVMRIGVKGFGIFFKNLYAMVRRPRALRQPGSKLDTGKQ